MDLISPFMKHPGDGPSFKYKAEISWDSLAQQGAERVDNYINALQANGLKIHTFSMPLSCRFWFQHEEDALAFKLKFKCV